MIDTRLAMFMVWGGGTVIVFTLVFLRRWRNYRRHRFDRRRTVRSDVRRDVVSGFALLLTAAGAAAAIFLVLFGQAGTGLRSFAIALALGGYLGAGLVMASEEDALSGEAPDDRAA